MGSSRLLIPLLETAVGQLSPEDVECNTHRVISEKPPPDLHLHAIERKGHDPSIEDLERGRTLRPDQEQSEHQLSHTSNSDFELIINKQMPKIALTSLGAKHAGIIVYTKKAH
jgi:hypothetical protein